MKPHILKTTYFEDHKAISLCGQQVTTTGVLGVISSEEISELKTDNLKMTMEIFLSGVVDTFNFELLKEKFLE